MCARPTKVSVDEQRSISLLGMSNCKMYRSCGLSFGWHSASKHQRVNWIADVGEKDGFHYLTMAFIEGQSLSDWLRGRHPLRQDHAATIIRKLAHALDEAH